LDATRGFERVRAGFSRFCHPAIEPTYNADYRTFPAIHTLCTHRNSSQLKRTDTQRVQTTILMSLLARSIFPELRTAFRLLEDPFFGRSPSVLAPTTTRGGGLDSPWSSLLSANYPAVDVHEKDNAWEVEAEVPGVRKEDIKVEYVVWRLAPNLEWGCPFFFPLDP
jgi:hypothetical protein